VATAFGRICYYRVDPEARDHETIRNLKCGRGNPARSFPFPAWPPIRKEGGPRQERASVLATLISAVANIGSVASAVLIVKAIIKMIMYAIDDEGRWRRLMVLVVPLLVLVLVLVLTVAGLTVWWLLCDGGVDVLLHHFGRT
jgi:hypothetical protein